MKNIYLLILPLLLLCCEGKGDNPVTMTVEWHDGVRLDTILISVDNIEVGRGDEAVERLFDKIRLLPQGSELVFRCPSDVALLLQSITGLPMEPLPFDSNDKYKKLLAEICYNKKMSYTLMLYDPKPFLK